MDKVFRDEFGRFTTRTKAVTFQEFEEDDWKKPEPIEEYEEIEEQYDEYEYFVGFDYETPSITVKGQKAFGVKGKHDFKTEFRVSSPTPLTEKELSNVIQSTFKDFAVLKNEESYEIKSETTRKVSERPSFDIKRTKPIER